MEAANTLVKMPRCWKSHVGAHYAANTKVSYRNLKKKHINRAFLKSPSKKGVNHTLAFYFHLSVVKT